jgi:WD40 repeat protein
MQVEFSFDSLVQKKFDESVIGPAGRWIAASRGPTIRLWNASDGTQLLELKLSDRVESLDASADGQMLAAATETGDVRTWRVSDGEALLQFDGRGKAAVSLAFSPNGARLALLDEGGILTIWDTTTSVQTVNVEVGAAYANQGIQRIVFHPDSTQIAVGDGTQIGIRDVNDGREVRVLRNHTGRPTSMDWSPDGRLIAVAADGSHAYLQDAETGETVATLSGPDIYHRRICFSPDGRRIASSDLETVHIWDTESGQEVLELPSFGDWLEQKHRCLDLRFTADGRRLMLVNDQGFTKTWDASQSMP